MPLLCKPAVGAHQQTRLLQEGEAIGHQVRPALPTGWEIANVSCWPLKDMPSKQFCIFTSAKADTVWKWMSTIWGHVSEPLVHSWWWTQNLWDTEPSWLMQATRASSFKDIPSLPCLSSLHPNCHGMRPSASPSCYSQAQPSRHFLSHNGWTIPPEG